MTVSSESKMMVTFSLSFILLRGREGKRSNPPQTVKRGHGEVGGLSADPLPPPGAGAGHGDSPVPPGLHIDGVPGPPHPPLRRLRRRQGPGSILRPSPPPPTTRWLGAGRLSFLTAPGKPNALPPKSTLTPGKLSGGEEVVRGPVSDQSCQVTTCGGGGGGRYEVTRACWPLGLFPAVFFIGSRKLDLPPSGGGESRKAPPGSTTISTPSMLTSRWPMAPLSFFSKAGPPPKCENDFEENSLDCSLRSNTGKRNPSEFKIRFEGKVVS